jgi:hypothetical protein
MLRFASDIFERVPYDGVSLSRALGDPAVNDNEPEPPKDRWGLWDPKRINGDGFPDRYDSAKEAEATCYREDGCDLLVALSSLDSHRLAAAEQLTKNRDGFRELAEEFAHGPSINPSPNFAPVSASPKDWTTLRRHRDTHRLVSSSPARGSSPGRKARASRSRGSRASPDPSVARRSRRSARRRRTRTGSGPTSPTAAGR